MSHRFHWLTGDTVSPIAPWDIDLTRMAPYATVPTKGAIVEGWLLTLPRSPVINIASLPSADRRGLLAQARATAVRRSGFSHQTAFFEHGPVAPDTVIGCGVDHAHLHSVPLSFDLLADLPKGMAWKPVDPNDPWEGLGSRDYLVVGIGHEWLACEPLIPQSQFFRRRIADAETAGVGWDHNSEPWTENVKRTIAHFVSG